MNWHGKKLLYLLIWDDEFKMCSWISPEEPIDQVMIIEQIMSILYAKSFSVLLLSKETCRLDMYL